MAYKMHSGWVIVEWSSGDTVVAFNPSFLVTRTHGYYDLDFRDTGPQFCVTMVTDEVILVEGDALRDMEIVPSHGGHHRFNLTPGHRCMVYNADGEGIKLDGTF